MLTTDYGINLSEFTSGDGAGSGFRGSKVLLHEPENCMECRKKFLSVYPVKSCSEHDGLESI